MQGSIITKTVSGVSSGKLGARSLATNMIAELAAMPANERPQRLLMIRLERLGRGNGLEAMEAFLQIRRMGIVVHTRLDGDVEYGRASELLMPVLRFFIGGMENEVRRDKLHAMYDRRRLAQRDDPTLAISTKMPYGLQLVGGHYAPKPPEDGAVKLAYQLKSQGYGSHLIAKRLAAIAPPMTLKDGSAHPQRWTADRVRRMLIKTSYRGTVIDEGTWERAQRHAREVTRPRMRYEYAFSGALRCECGYALFGQRGPRNTSAFLYYCCRNTVAHQGRYKFYRSDRIEEQFLAMLDRMRAEDDLVERFLDAQSNDRAVPSMQGKRASAKADLAALDDKRRQIFAAFETGKLAVDDLQGRLDDLKGLAAELTGRIALLDREIALARAAQQSVVDARALIASATSLWQEACADDRRALAKAISRAFGGLYLKADCTLVIGAVVPPKRSPKRKGSN